MTDETPTRISGRAWTIVDSNGRFIDDIDTDQIFHNSHLAITDINEMGQHAFGNLEGWEDFPGKVQDGDILIVGKNFGAGSSRQQAVDCFRALGIKAVLGISFGSIYWRNAINSGMPVLVWPKADGVVSDELITPEEVIEIDFVSGEARNSSRGMKLPPLRPFSSVQLDIYGAGGLFAYAKK
jgi:3-isopropylmalate/(R)-2-methylmalate dehydratase small subunit